jgi:hypothetical protein
MAKTKYEGLFNCPASDGNFASAIGSLSVDELEAFKCELITRDLDEHCHKGRINAATKEIGRRGSNSLEIVAVEKIAEDIVTADTVYGDGMVYELDRIENEIRFWQDQAGVALLEMGKRFIRIKAHEEPGKFMQVVERLGMAQRSVNYAMAAARRFSNSPTLANLASSKMKALTVLDEDDIKTLESGGDIAGMNLDDIDRMSTRELRENLRKKTEQVKKEKETRKKERTAFEQSMLQKDAKINDLDMQLSGREPPTREQLAKDALDDLNGDYTVTLGQVNSSLRNALAPLTKAEKIEDVNVQQLRDWLNQFEFEMTAFRELSQTWTDEIENAGPIKDWRLSDLPDLSGGEEA